MTKISRIKLKTVKGTPIEGVSSEYEGTKVGIHLGGISFLIKGAEEPIFFWWHQIDSLKFYHRKIKRISKE